MYTTTAVDHMGEKPEVMSLNLVVPSGRALIRTAKFSCSPFVKKLSNWK